MARRDITVTEMRAGNWGFFFGRGRLRRDRMDREWRGASMVAKVLWDSGLGCHLMFILHREVRLYAKSVSL